MAYLSELRALTVECTSRCSSRHSIAIRLERSLTAVLINVMEYGCANHALTASNHDAAVTASIELCDALDCNALSRAIV
jgi:hypothetical protein